MRELHLKTIIKIFKPRKADSHKGDHGHALLIAGSKGRTGAAVIAAKACLRGGCGLLTVIVPQEERMILQSAVPEAMLSFREETHDIKKFSALGIGPAIGTDDASHATIKKIFNEYALPLLLDADALTVLAADKKLFELIPKNTIITPHPKEFDRMFGAHGNEEERGLTAIRIAKEKNIVIVLKGHHTLVTSGEKSLINTTGNAGLAKGGSGDALTGLITSFLAQQYSPLHAAMLGVYIHGLSADLCLKTQSTESMLITDVIGYFGKAFEKLQSR